MRTCNPEVVAGDCLRVAARDYGFAARPRPGMAEVLSPYRPRRMFRRRLGRRRRWWRRFPHRLEALGLRGGVEIIDEFGDARGIAAEVAFEIARGGADIDAGIFPVRPYPNCDVLAEAHDRRARHRLDGADVARQPRRTLVNDEPFSLVDEPQHDRKGTVHRKLDTHRFDIRKGFALQLGGIEPGIGRGVGAVAAAQAA